MKLAIAELMTNSGVRFGTSGVRGLVSEMTNDVCYAYTQAFLQEVVAEEVTQLVLGHDLRPSSPGIAAVCAQAIRDSGREVRYAGALPTPALAYYAATLSVPAVVITGSHIPFDRNGIKFYRAEGEISKTDEERITAAAVSIPSFLSPYSLSEPETEARSLYLRRYLDFFGEGALRGYRIAVYEHSSVARDLLRPLFEALGADVISLGRAEGFVPIDTEAVRMEDVVQAKNWAKQHQFDAIVSTDGDADRPLIGDETGEWLRGDVVGILCARYLGARTVVTPVSSNTALERCAYFDQIIRTRIGSPFVIAGMESSAGQEASVVGYEANGGFLVGSDIVRAGRRLAALPTRDAILPMLALLSMARQQHVTLSQLSKSLPPRFTHSDRLQNVQPEYSQNLMGELLAHPVSLSAILAPDCGNPIKVDQTDGLRVTFHSGDIVHLRPSGNAPELRCYAESDSAPRAKALCDACLERIRLASCQK